METPNPPAEATLIAHALRLSFPKLSIRRAAKESGLSEGRWRQITKGYQATGQGSIPVIAPADTIARMALTVGVTSDQLVKAGRPDAARVLDALLDESPPSTLESVPTRDLLNEIERRIEGASNVTKSRTPITATSAQPRAQGEAPEDEKTGDNVSPLIPPNQGARPDQPQRRAARKVRGPSEIEVQVREQDEAAERGDT